MQVQRVQNNSYNTNFGCLKIKQTPQNTKILNDLENAICGKELLQTIENMKNQMKDTKFFHIYLGDNLKPELLSTKDAYWGNFVPMEKTINRTTKYGYKKVDSELTKPILFNEYQYYGYPPLMTNYNERMLAVNGVDYEKIERLNGRVSEDGLVPYKVTEYTHRNDVPVEYDSIGEGIVDNKPYGYTNTIHMADYYNKLLKMAKELEKLSKNAE